MGVKQTRLANEYYIFDNGVNGMLIENGDYTVNICRDEAFTVGSTDNKLYDTIFNPCNMERSDYYKVLSICIDGNDNHKCIALIGSMFGADENIAVLEGHNLIVLMNTTLTVIDCSVLTIKYCQNISNGGTYFAIQKFDDGYIVYGELDILKLSTEYETMWLFSGADIFVTQDGSNPFYVDNNIIYLTDWNGTKYIVDKFGNEIS